MNSTMFPKYKGNIYGTICMYYKRSVHLATFWPTRSQGQNAQEQIGNVRFMDEWNTRLSGVFRITVCLVVVYPFPGLWPYIYNICIRLYTAMHDMIHVYPAPLPGAQNHNHVTCHFVCRRNPLRRLCYFSSGSTLPIVSLSQVFGWGIEPL